MAGKLVLVVGPSGAGKDTLISAAADRLMDNRRFVFVRRLITREPDDVTEDHVAISRAEFDELVAAGDVALAWQAHGLGYIIPKDVARLIATGKIAVCNGSRHAVAEARRRYPNCAVVLVTASRPIRARRLAARGRESLEDITARLERESAPFPEDVEVVTVDNSGHLAESIDAFCNALTKLARQAEEESASA